MPKTQQCDRCLFCAHDPRIVCAIHPAGPRSHNCIDFRPDPELEGKRFVDFLELQRQPEAPSYYDRQLIVQPQQRWTREEQMELLDQHPLFTGRCPECGATIERDYLAKVHFDCVECGWMNDSV